MNSAELFQAILDFRELFKCSQCGKIFEDPYSLNECSCTFCKDCVEDYVGERTECPKCGTLAIPKNCRKNPLKVVAKEKMKSKKGQEVSKDGNQDNCSKRKSAPVQPITNQHELRKKRRSMQM